MPELPEVETIRRDLETLILHGELESIEVVEKVHLLKNCTQTELEKRIVGKSLDRIGRRGKFLLFHFGSEIMILHLRMSGRLLTEPANHSRLILNFSDERIVYFDDARRFGMLFLANSANLEELPSIKHLGIEPLSSNYCFEAFKSALNSRREIKQVLLDQTKITGLGNIYASEALFRAKIHPAKCASQLTKLEAERLYEMIPAVLEHAIHARGTSISTYQTPSGELGNFQDDFQVYGRTGSECSICQSTIERIVHGGRSSFFCPTCQPLH